MKKMQIMGILNCTPDSFYDKGAYFAEQTAIKKGISLIEEGAHILDVGGESTRPYASYVSEKEELRRVIPVIKALKRHSSCPLSIDTYKPKVAEKALEAGASWINDITGFSSAAMRKIARESQAMLCVMHMQNNPQTMQTSPSYPRGVVTEILQWFQERVHLLLSEGICASKIILDPGIGFGKTLKHNIEILQNLSQFTSLGYPLLLGTSRKSFLSKITHKQPKELLSTTLVVNTISLLRGVSIFRVHDVREHRDLIKVLDYLKQTTCPFPII